MVDKLLNVFWEISKLYPGDINIAPFNSTKFDLFPKNLANNDDPALKPKPYIGKLEYLDLIKSRIISTSSGWPTVLNLEIVNGIECPLLEYDIGNKFNFFEIFFTWYADSV